MERLISLSALMVDAAVKATVLLALAWMACVLLKKRSAATRHTVRAFVLGSLVLLPFSALLPAWHVRGIPEFAPAPALKLPAEQPKPAPQVAEKHGPARFKVDSYQSAASNRAVNRAKTLRASAHEENSSVQKVFSPSAPAAPKVDPGLRQTAVETEHTPAVLATSARQQASRSMANWLPALALVWLCGAAMMLCRWFVSLAQLSRLVRQAKPLDDPAWSAQTRAVARELGIRRPVALLESRDTDVPLATGLFHPKVILPLDHQEWAEIRRGAILHHEMAHIKRLDTMTQTLAQAATVLFWFHPLAWIMAGAMRAERERACDDQVLAGGTKASDYAHELLEIVSSLRKPELAAALAMARRSQLEGRVLAVLDPGLRRGSVSRGATVAVALVTLCVTLPLAALRPAQQENERPAPAVIAPQAEDHDELDSLRAQLAAIESEASSNAARAKAVAPEIAAMRAQIAVMETGDPSALAEIRAKIAALEASNVMLPGNDAQLLELEGKLAEIEARLASFDAQEKIEAPEPPEPPEAPEGPDEPGILGGVPEGIPGGVEGGIPGGVPAVPSVPGVPGVPAVPAVPGVPAVPAVPPAPGGGEISACGTRAELHNLRIESHNGDKHWIATWSGDDCTVDLRAEGEIQFNADATELQSISGDGYFEVSERHADMLRYIKITPSANGLQYVYKINGQQQPLEGEAKTWFSNFLLALERSTGFAAEERVAKLIAKGGPGAVLDEINNLQGDYVRGIYFRKLLDHPNLPSPIVIRIINQAGSQIGSDYEMARVLMEVGKQYDLADEASRAAFLNAAAKLKSDYEHSRVLIELLKRPNISSENVRAALNSAAGIKSDYEKSRILLALVAQKTFEQSYLDSYLKLVASIGSDYEKSRDLLAPMEKYSLSPEQVNRILDAAAGMSNDYEKSRLLNGLAGKGKFDESQIGNYLKVVASMGSDYERSRSLLTLMEHNDLTAASVSKALEEASRMGNDYEKSRLLVALVKVRKFDEKQIGTYLKVVDSMTSDYERARNLGVLISQNKLSDTSLAKVLEEAARMNSDYDKAQLLVALARDYSLQGPLRESYIKAADSIHSEYERNRALAAVVRRASL
jgi:beta-lactamase regulating signal transducer with metallopeptidase domain